MPDNAIECVYVDVEPPAEVAQLPALRDGYCEVSASAFPGFWRIDFPSTTSAREIVAQVSRLVGTPALTVDDVEALFDADTGTRL